MHSKWYKGSLKRWIITAAHCCSSHETTKNQNIIMADSVVAYFGEHSEFGYGKTGPALKSERGLIWPKPLECYNVLD